MPPPLTDVLDRIEKVEGWLTDDHFRARPGTWRVVIGKAKLDDILTPVQRSALNQLTRHLAADVEGTGVTANVIHPGDVRTAMWAEIRDEAERLGEIAMSLAQWASWVDETGGDPSSKAVELVVRIIEGDVNGQFLWIDDPLRAPVPSWGYTLDP